MDDIILVAQKAIGRNNGCDCTGCIARRKFEVENNVFKLYSFMVCLVNYGNACDYENGMNRAFVKAMLKDRKDIQLVGPNQYVLLHNRPDLKLQTLLR